jgi:hypothetical protein
MKKLLLSLPVLLCTCTSLIAASNVADTVLPCVAAYERNNTFETAAQIPLNTDIHGALHPSRDVDVYEFNVAGYANLHITLHNPAANAAMSLYDENHYELVGPQHPGATDDYIDYSVSGGKFYVYIARNGKASRTCYTLNVGVTYPQVCQDTFEYNDVLDSAKTIVIGQVVAGKLSENNDRDYFKFTLDTPSTIRAYISNIPLEDVEFNLLNANGTLIRPAIHDTANQTKYIFHYGAPAGTYYLSARIDGYGVSNECYQLTVNAQPSQECAESYEPNENDIEAPEIPVNTDIISKLQNEDFYIFYNSTGSSDFEVRVDGLWPDCRVHLMEYSTLSGIGFDHVNYNEDYASIRVFDAQATYYIVHVSPYTGGTSSSKCYKLRIDIPGAATARKGAATKNDSTIKLVKLYPVPTSGKVLMEITTSGEKEKYITISDLSGRIVFRQKYGVIDGLNKLEITMPSNLSNGVYVISDGKQARKILLRR